MLLSLMSSQTLFLFKTFIANITCEHCFYTLIQIIMQIQTILIQLIKTLFIFILIKSIQMLNICFITHFEFVFKFIYLLLKVQCKVLNNLQQSIKAFHIFLRINVFLILILNFIHIFNYFGTLY